MKIPFKKLKMLLMLSSHYLCHLSVSIICPLEYIENYILSCFLVSLVYAVSLSIHLFFISPLAVIVTLR